MTSGGSQPIVSSPEAYQLQSLVSNTTSTVRPTSSTPQSIHSTLPSDHLPSSRAALLDTTRCSVPGISPSSPNPSTATSPPSTFPIPRPLTAKLYTSHLLSTWNSRSFEFGSVLFLTSIYPDTLLYLSVYAMLRSASAIVGASAVGSAIDSRGRKEVVRTSIVAGRLSVALSALGFWGLWSHPQLGGSYKTAVFAVLIALACVEKLASVMNVVAIERDWVVVIAEGNEAVLQKINARMRRIDLLCKLAGPLCIALVDGVSTEAAIWSTLGLNVLSLPVEYFAIANVYNAVPKLREPKEPALESEAISHHCRSGLSSLDTFFISMADYFAHPAWLPSFSLALLYLTVLSFSGQMVTFLVASGFNSFHIALTRSLATMIELSATWIAPRVMARISPARGGMWFLSWQMLWLAATIGFFYAEKRPIVAASGLAAGTIMSRVGLWGFDLCAQTIVQMEVRDTNRGSFSSTEAMFQNVFELVSFALTIVLPRPDQFRWPVLVSVVVTFSAGGLYAFFLRKRRGHLLHLPCIEHKTAGA